MQRQRFAAVVALATLVAHAGGPGAGARAAANVALAGVASSQEEGAMEGVVVSARRQGENVTV